MTMPHIGSRKLVLIPLLVALAVVAFYPWESIVVPEWRVRIVDQSGSPLRNTGVREGGKSSKSLVPLPDRGRSDGYCPTHSNSHRL